MPEVAGCRFHSLAPLCSKTRALVSGNRTMEDRMKCRIARYLILGYVLTLFSAALAFGENKPVITQAFVVGSQINITGANFLGENGKRTPVVMLAGQRLSLVGPPSATSIVVQL